MTEYQFFSNSFFDELQSKPSDVIDLSEIKQLISDAQISELENKKFIQSWSITMSVLGLIMIVLGVSSLFFSQSLVWIIISCTFSVFVFIHALDYEPDHKIKKSLQKFQKSLAQGLRKSANKRIYRSKSDRIIFGLLGGIAKYTGISAWFLRLVALSLLFFSGGVVLFLYIIFASILPVEETLPERED